MTAPFQIGKRTVGPGHPCFVIGELSCNHNGDLTVAIDTVKAMHRAGADCVKLQTMRPDYITMQSDSPEFTIGGGTLWDNRSLHDLYKEVQTPWEQPVMAADPVNPPQTHGGTRKTNSSACNSVAPFINSIESLATHILPSADVASTQQPLAAGWRLCRCSTSSRTGQTREYRKVQEELAET